MIHMYVYFCLLSALSFVEMKPLNINAHVGKNVEIKCSDWPSITNVKSNVKYLCVSPCKKDKHIILKAAFGETARGSQTELTNSADGLFVTFFNVQKSDSKKYYCGAERLGLDSYIEVTLKVTDAKSSSPKTAPTTVNIGSALLFGVTNSSILPTITNKSTPNIIRSTKTTTTSATQGVGSVPYLIIGVIVLITTLIVLLKLMRKMTKKRLKVEDAHEDGEYEEIGPQDQQTVNQQTVVSTLYVSADLDSLYDNCSYHKDTRLYSVVQLPKTQIEPTGQSEANQTESNENDFLYSLAELPKST